MLNTQLSPNDELFVSVNVANRRSFTLTVNVPLIIHWDGKLVEGMADEGIAERLPILVSGDGIQKLLMVPKLAAGTGVLTGQAVYDAAKEWDLVENIIGMCLDTTASNTGLKEGACVHLMQHVKRNLLHFACRHHVLELVVGAAFIVCFGPSSGPEIPLFKRFVKWWPLTNQASPKPLDDPVDGADKIIATCHALLKKQQPRDDYREMVQLTILVLGGEVEANIRKPGAYHRARWMAKVIYTLKITLFREQFALTEREKRALIRFTTFIVTTYVEPWMSAHCSTSAPATDLALLKALAAYRDKEIGRASGKVMARHLWYLSEELVGLSLFDEATVVEEKRAIVSSRGWETRIRQALPEALPGVVRDGHMMTKTADFIFFGSSSPVLRFRTVANFFSLRSYFPFSSDSNCELSTKSELNGKMWTTVHPGEIACIWETLIALRDGIKLSNRNKILHTSLYHSIDKNSDPARRIRKTFTKWTTLMHSHTKNLRWPIHISTWTPQKSKKVLIVWWNAHLVKH